MVGEDIGWYPLDIFRICLLLAEMVVVILIPGLFLAWVFFPDIKDLFDRLIFAFLLGILPLFTVAFLNMAVNFRVDFITTLLVISIFIIIGFVAYFIKKGHYGHADTDENKGE